ncbi:MAG: hypothetical protein ACHQHN_09095 [Sphingobacteriales bacterium]
MKSFVLTTILLTFSILSYAQTTIKPGDKAIRYDWIQPGHDFYRATITDTAGKLLNDYVLEDYIIIDPSSKQITFARYRQVPAGQFETDTSVTDQYLKPIRMHEIHYQRNVTFDMQFGETQATVKTTRKSVETTKAYPMKAGYFENNMTEYIFGYLDLKKGVTYTLDNFNRSTPAPSDPFTVEYAFDDVLTGAAERNAACTVLHFIHGDTSGYMWIDKASHLTVKTVGNFKGGRYVITKV